LHLWDIDDARRQRARMTQHGIRIAGIRTTGIRMSQEWPKITSRDILTLSPWTKVIVREVEFAAGAKPQTYHALGQHDYLTIVAVTPDGRIPLVRQYRPATESFTLELPAGLLEPGEEPAAASARELLEETGYPAKSVHWLGTSHACTARMSNQVHSFYIETGPKVTDFRPEEGIEMMLATPAEFADLILAQQFKEQMQLGTVLLAQLRGFLRLPR
jgi:ADP-ribose pyrophosphatase